MQGIWILFHLTTKDILTKSTSTKWQRHDCGTIVPIYEAKKESMIKDFVEPSNDPFDQGKTIIGLGNKKKKTAFQKERQRQKDRIDKEKDPDIKRELRKGNNSLF